MGDNRNNVNLGDQILKTVDEILDSGNFEKLNSVVLDTVSKALDEAKKQLDKASGSVGGTGTGAKETSSAKATTTGAKTATGAAEAANAKAATRAAETASAKAATRAAETASAKAATGVTKAATTNTATNVRVSSGNKAAYHPVLAPKAKLKRVGSVSGVLLQVFGGIGMGVFGILFIIFFLSAILGKDYTGLTVFMGAMACVCGAVIVNGAEKRARLKRAERYIQVMQGKSYMNISDLALLANKSQRFVRKDIRKMIQLGIFPEGHLDQKEACLMLNDTAYREYMRLEKRRMALVAEEEETKRSRQIAEQQSVKESAKEETFQETDNAELNSLIAEGNKCIRQLRDLNDAIEGEVISRKLFELENLLKEIFEQVKEHPEQMPEMHKFMDYYLPTTLKLVTAYEEFDRVSVPGQDILSAKTEIEKTLDTINMAFAELLNKLFRDRAFDAATDAQVLKTMLAREGLTKEPAFAEGAGNRKSSL